MFIILIGPPGSGKGTQSERLIESLDITHISTGEILRQAMNDRTPLGQEARQYVDAGQLVPDLVVTGIVCQRLENPDCKSGCLFDGFPRTIAQAEALDAFLDGRGTPLQLVLELQVEEDELTRRLLGRGRKDDTPETIANRLQVYSSQTKPLLDYYRQRNLLESVEGMGTPDDIFARVKSRIDVRRRESDKDNSL